MKSRAVTTVMLLACGVWFLLGTLPYLADYPVLDWPQMGIAAPAHKLATEGVYGNDLFTGFHRNEQRNYEYMPAYPLLVAISFKFLGLGVTQARLVSVVCALLTLLLTYKTGTMLFDRAVGIGAVAILVLVRFNPGADGSGVPLVDFARVIRYDILVPVFVLAACVAFLNGLRSVSGSKRNWWFFGAGYAGGLATLSHVYGSFVLTAFVVFLVWQSGWSQWRRFPVYGLMIGWMVGVLPWGIYVLQDVPAYVGQMTRHEGRFDILNIGFYATNLLGEFRRYANWTGSFPEGLWLPRIGFWVICCGVVGGWVVLSQRVKDVESQSARFALVTLPILALQLALFVSLKRGEYTVLVLPFIAIQVAFWLVHIWRWAVPARRRAFRVGVALVLVLMLVEGGLGVAKMLRAARQTTSYQTITSAIADAIPVGSTVLLSQPYWMGLAEYDARSINLPFVKANDVQFEETLRDLSPDFVVVERFFIDPSIPDPRRSPNPYWIDLWNRFGAFVEDSCSRVLGLPDPSYGVVDVYECRSSDN